MDDHSDWETVKITRNGQVTIPNEIRDELGIDTPGRIRFVQNEEGEIMIRPVKRPSKLQGELASEVDDKQQSATELLREERKRDKQKSDEK